MSGKFTGSRNIQNPMFCKAQPPPILCFCAQKWMQGSHLFLKATQRKTSSITWASLLVSFSRQQSSGHNRWVLPLVLDMERKREANRIRFQHVWTMVSTADVKVRVIKVRLKKAWQSLYKWLLAPEAVRLTQLRSRLLQSIQIWFYSRKDLVMRKYRSDERCDLHRRKTEAECFFLSDACWDLVAVFASGTAASLCWRCSALQQHPSHVKSRSLGCSISSPKAQGLWGCWAGEALSGSPQTLCLSAPVSLGRCSAALFLRTLC